MYPLGYKKQANSQRDSHDAKTQDPAVHYHGKTGRCREIGGPGCQAQGVSDHQLVQQLYKRKGSWAAVSDALGRSPAFWWKVAHRKIKTPLPEDIRRYLVSSEPQLLRMICETAVPWLSSRERGAKERLRTKIRAGCL